MERLLTILAINSGSSSLKFKLFSDTQPMKMLVSGNVTGIGAEKSGLVITRADGTIFSYGDIVVKAPTEAAILVLEWLQQQEEYKISGIGHRLVQGNSNYSAPAVINDKLTGDLKTKNAPPNNQPALSIIRIFRQAFLSVIQIACFDTFFHKQPDSYHGLSCEYITEQLEQMEGTPDNKKTIIAHLGDTCSLTAIKGKESADNTMAFSSPVESEYTDIYFKESANAFCHHVKKHIGALSAAMGGLDTLVFTGGIGEHQARIRSRVCNDLEFLGIRVNDVLNKQSFCNISGSNSRVNVCVIKTNEEIVIARNVRQYIKSENNNSHPANGYLPNDNQGSDRTLLATSKIPDYDTNLILKQSPGERGTAS